MWYGNEWGVNAKLKYQSKSVYQTHDPWIVKMYDNVVLPVTLYYVTAGPRFGFISG